MSYKNFIPTVWAEAIEHELERNHVFVADTNRQYEGNVSKMGDTVRILGIGKPSVTTQVGGSINLNTAETVEDSAVSLLIDHVSYFNYLVDDIDKRQAVGGLMDALSKEASQALANETDLCVSAMSKAKGAKKKDTTAVQVTAGATGSGVVNILEYIDAGLEKLYENDVKPDSEITLTVPPWFYIMLKQAYVKLDTDNSTMLENGKVGRYGNVIVRMSNNVCKDNNDSLIQLKTKRAIAFAQPMTHTEPYRPEAKFSDAVKGFILYGAKIVRPKEMIILNCHA
jgi:hypothetical protein